MEAKKTYLIKIIIITALLTALSSCCQTWVFTPPHNAEHINTQNNELSPVQKPDPGVSCAPCEAEFRTKAGTPYSGVKPSFHFLRNMLGDKFADGTASLTYVTDTSGFFSVAHPPDTLAAQLLHLPLKGILGGTDIFEFTVNDGNYIFSNLGDKINSLVWDSHPFAIQDDSCNLLLMWSSDRNAPFKIIRDRYDSIKSYSGNTDIYYAFRKNGVWSEVKTFAVNSGSVNSSANDESPLIYCLCHRPYLLFSSNRKGVDYNDYDLFYTKINIDFGNQKVTQEDDIYMFPKGKDSINTYSKEIFPYIAKPYSIENMQPELYFASDRYAEEEDIGWDSIMVNFGLFDIYHYDIDLKCTPPKVMYHVKLLNAENPREAVQRPYIRVIDKESGKEIQSEGSNNARFVLDYGKQYIVEGTSFHDQIICESGKDRTISHYTDRIINHLGSKTIKKDTIIKYPMVYKINEIIGTDTVEYTEEITAVHLALLEENPKIRVKSVESAGSKLKVNYQQFHEIRATTVNDTVEKEKIITIEYKKDFYDTVYNKLSSSHFTPSERTKVLSYVEIEKAKDVKFEFDTIYAWPHYYYFPPCEWEYIRHNIDYRRNVPYFQTCYWEVNTSENLKVHQREFNTPLYADASFIELHPMNSYFGFRRTDLGQDADNRRARYNRRVNEYEEFASMVDENLKDMASEIADFILPDFAMVDSLNPNDNKLLILLHAYSDKRPISSGRFVSDTAVKYTSVTYDTISNQITAVNTIDIQPDSSLVGENNDVLSKLRAYFGWHELQKVLQDSPLYKQYMDKGLVLTPEDYSSMSELKSKLRNAKIAFLIEGRQADTTQELKYIGYVGKEGDFKSLDPTRRINVIVKRIEYIGDQIRVPDCCTPTESPIYKEKVLSLLKKDYDYLTRQLIDQSESADVKVYTESSVSANSTTVPGSDAFFTISFGAYSSQKNAYELFKFLEAQGVADLRMLTVPHPRYDKLYKLRAGIFTEPELAKIKAQEYYKLLKENKINAAVAVMKEQGELQD